MYLTVTFRCRAHLKCVYSNIKMCFHGTHVYKRSNINWRSIAFTARLLIPVYNIRDLRFVNNVHISPVRGQIRAKRLTTRTHGNHASMKVYTNLLSMSVQRFYVVGSTSFRCIFYLEMLNFLLHEFSWFMQNRTAWNSLFTRLKISKEEKGLRH